MEPRSRQTKPVDDKRAALLARMAKARAAKRSSNRECEHKLNGQTTSASIESVRSGFLEIVGIGLLIAATGLLIYGGIVLGRECKVWLQTGKWEPVSTYELWYRLTDHPPHFEWVGVAQIVNWLLSSSLAGVLISLSVGLYFLLLLIIAKM